MPTLIVWGRNDGIVPFEKAELLDAAIPRSRLFTVDSCGHIPHEEKPRETVSVIVSFLAQGMDAEAVTAS